LKGWKKRPPRWRSCLVVCAIADGYQGGGTRKARDVSRITPIDGEMMDESPVPPLDAFAVFAD
jgi:hypothetical protein